MYNYAFEYLNCFTLPNTHHSQLHIVMVILLDTACILLDILLLPSLGLVFGLFALSKMCIVHWYITNVCAMALCTGAYSYCILWSSIA